MLEFLFAFPLFESNLHRGGVAVPRTCLLSAVVTVLAGLGTGFAGQDRIRPTGGPEPAARPPAAAPLPGGDWFTDEAASAGLDFVHVNGMSGEYRFAEMMGPGAAVLDFDNDGDLDLYLPQGHLLGAGAAQDDRGAPLKDRLYRNDLAVHADGSRTLRFTDVTDSSGLDVRSYGMGVATGDFDNDGRVDLFLTQLGPERLFRNAGDGTFAEAPGAGGASDPRWSLSATVLDYDRDGWLDLYVAHYVDHDAEGNAACYAPTGERDYCGPQQYLPVPDRLYRNLGGGRFADRTAEAQVATEYGPALGVVASDVDGDGWTDIYVANDGQENQLWVNRRDGTFRNDALLAGVALNDAGRAEAGMGVDAGDFDNDGDEDLFVTHLVTQTNTLYVNTGAGLFEDRSAASGLGAPSLPYTGFGAVWFDFDNDGWLDVLAVNGAVNTIRALAQAEDPHPLHQRNQLFRNLGNGRFEDVSRRAGAVFGLSEVSRGAAVGDLDNDGDLDLFVTNNNGRARLLINHVGNRNRWLGLRLVGGDPPRDMLGARVGIFRRGGPPLWRRSRTDGSYASGRDPRVLVGLGDARTVPRLRVVWPSGRTEEWTDVAADQWLTLQEGTGRRRP